MSTTTIGPFTVPNGDDLVSNGDNLIRGIATTLSGMNIESVAASRPAAGTKGRVHRATDTNVVSRDNGSTWDQIYPTITVPVVDSAAATTTGITNFTIGTLTQSVASYYTYNSGSHTLYPAAGGLYLVTAVVSAGTSAAGFEMYLNTTTQIISTTVGGSNPGVISGVFRLTGGSSGGIQLAGLVSATTYTATVSLARISA